jgi:hypothetical protein
MSNAVDLDPVSLAGTQAPWIAPICHRCLDRYAVLLPLNCLNTVLTANSGIIMHTDYQNYMAVLVYASKAE